MAKKLIINADDMGLREAVNRGILAAHKNGVVTSVSLFAEGEGVADAVRIIKENPSLGVGIHLNLDKFFVIDHGRGVASGYVSPKPSLEEIRAEIYRQMDIFQGFGLSACCDHIDSHHHTHLTPDIFPIVADAAKERGVTFVRLPAKLFPNYSVFEGLKKILDERGLRCIDHFIEGWYWGNVDENYTVAELLTHPGYGELWREAELAHCCQPQLKSYFTEQKIEVIRFSDIK